MAKAQEQLPPQNLVSDLVTKEMNNGRFQIRLTYFNPLVDGQKLLKSLVEPFLDLPDSEAYDILLQALPSCEPIKPDQLMSKILTGFIVISIKDKHYAYEAKQIHTSSAEEVKVESTVQGPQLGLSENNQTNLNLIRYRYASENLRVEKRQLGSISKTEAYVLYDAGRVNTKALERLKIQLDQVKAEYIQSPNELENELTYKKWKLLPTTIITERPDRIALSLGEGKAVILLQGTPFALIAPVTFSDIMAVMDDRYNEPWFTLFIKILRYCALAISIVLPALYILVASYDSEFTRLEFILSIASSRAAVPYPSYVEVAIMLFMIEALVEASIRLPKAIGSTATTVGGLILGQAAVSAGLVSTALIIVTSLVAISNYVIPTIHLSNAIRLLKYPFVILAIYFGVVGIVVGLFLLIMFVTDLRSFGEPFFKLPGGRIQDEVR